MTFETFLDKIVEFILSHKKNYAEQRNSTNFNYIDNEKYFFFVFISASFSNNNNNNIKLSGQ